MSLQPLLINGEFRTAANPTGSYQSTNPMTGEELPWAFPYSEWDDIEAVLRAAADAVSELRTARRQLLADFLDTYAARIEVRADALVEAAHLETGLPAPTRLNAIELPRTTDQLRQAAAAVRDCSWTQATIDTAAGIRSFYGPLPGAVVVFGPNNFPFAFNGAAGGDFAAAIAAGSPVIAKAHSSHSRTSQLLAEAALEAIHKTGAPKGLVQLIYRFKPEYGYDLVADPRVAAVGFTGSREGGMRLKEVADRHGKPIYLEMSSINPILLLPGALTERPQAIAEEFFTSCTMGTGQFCTNPGLVMTIAGEEAEEFVAQTAALFNDGAAGVLLNRGVSEGMDESIQILTGNGAKVVAGGSAADAPGYYYRSTLLTVSGAEFLANPQAMQTEAFGPSSLVILAQDADQMEQIIQCFEGNLTGCLYTDNAGSDDNLYDRLAPLLRGKVGRLLNDKMPTGVAVTAAMNHGGPFPATGHPGFTSVGIPASISRFSALYSYDNVRQHRLPPELRDQNPTGAMWRLVDQQWTQADINA